METSQSHATPLIVHDLSAGELNITRGVNKQCVKKGNTLSSSAKELSSAKISLPPSAYVDDWAIKLSSRSDCWNLTESIKLSDFCRSSLEELCATEMESKVQKGGDNFVKAKKKDSSKKKLKSKSSHDSLDFKNKTCSSANNSFAAQENLLNIEQEILKSCSEIISDLDARTAEIASLVSQNNDEGNTSFSSYSSVRDCENVSIKQRMSRKDRPRKSKQVKSDTNNVDPTTLVFDSNKSEDNVYGDHARPYQMKGVSPPYPIEIIPLKDTSLIYKDPYSMNSILSDDENILNNEILLSSQKKKGSKSLKSMPEKKTTKKKSALKSSNMQTPSMSDSFTDGESDRYHRLSINDQDSGVELSTNLVDVFNVSMSSAEESKKKVPKTTVEEPKKDKKPKKAKLAEEKMQNNSCGNTSVGEVPVQKVPEVCTLNSSPGSRRKSTKIKPVANEPSKNDKTEELPTLNSSPVRRKKLTNVKPLAMNDQNNVKTVNDDKKIHQIKNPLDDIILYQNLPPLEKESNRSKDAKNVGNIKRDKQLVSQKFEVDAKCPSQSHKMMGLNESKYLPENEVVNDSKIISSIDNNKVVKKAKKVKPVEDTLLLNELSVMENTNTILDVEKTEGTDSSGQKKKKISKQNSQDGNASPPKIKKKTKHSLKNDYKADIACIEDLMLTSSSEPLYNTYPENNRCSDVDSGTTVLDSDRCEIDKPSKYPYDLDLNVCSELNVQSPLNKKKLLAKVSNLDEIQAQIDFQVEMGSNCDLIPASDDICESSSEKKNAVEIHSNADKEDGALGTTIAWNYHDTTSNLNTKPPYDQKSSLQPIVSGTQKMLSELVYYIPDTSYNSVHQRSDNLQMAEKVEEQKKSNAILLSGEGSTEKSASHLINGHVIEKKCGNITQVGKKDIKKTNLLSIDEVPSLSSPEINKSESLNDINLTESLSEGINRYDSGDYLLRVRDSDESDAERNERATSLPPQSRRNLSVFRPTSADPSASMHQHYNSNAPKLFRPSVTRLTKTQLVASLPELRIKSNSTAGSGVQRRAFSKIVEIIKMFTVTEEIRPEASSKGSATNKDTGVNGNNLTTKLLSVTPIINDYICEMEAKVRCDSSSVVEMLEVARPDKNEANSASQPPVANDYVCDLATKVNFGNSLEVEMLEVAQPVASVMKNYNKSNIKSLASSQHVDSQKNLLLSESTQTESNESLAKETMTDEMDFDAVDKTFEVICEMLEIARNDCGKTEVNPFTRESDLDLNGLPLLCEEGSGDMNSASLQNKHKLLLSPHSSDNETYDDSVKVPSPKIRDMLDSGYCEETDSTSNNDFNTPGNLNSITEEETVSEAKSFPNSITPLDVPLSAAEDQTLLLEALVTDTFEVRNYRLRVYERRESIGASRDRVKDIVKRHSWNAESFNRWNRRSDDVAHLHEFYPDLPIDIFDVETQTTK